MRALQAARLFYYQQASSCFDLCGHVRFIEQRRHDDHLFTIIRRGFGRNLQGAKTAASSARLSALLWHLPFRSMEIENHHGSIAHDARRVARPAVSSICCGVEKARFVSRVDRHYHAARRVAPSAISP